MAELAAARGMDVLAVVRSKERAESLANKGFRVTRDLAPDVARECVDADTHAVICFPPDGKTDAELAKLLRHARAVSYVSTTGVYGDATGTIDDTTPVSASPSPRLDAEAAYREIGGTVLRAPGIYGPDRGMHVRVVSGLHKLPGAGDNVISRIHVDDLAALLLASSSVRGRTFVVGDREPAKQRDVVSWIRAEYGCAMPPSVPPEEVHESLRRNRRVDASGILKELGVTLRYPTYREGMKREIG